MKKLLIAMLLALSIFALSACGGGKYITRCARCGREIELPSKPASNMVAYCVDCLGEVNAENAAG